MKKYELQEKFILQQFIMNFADFRRNKIFMQNKQTNKQTKNMHLKYQMQEKVTFPQLVSNFVDFLRKFSVFMQNKLCTLKKYQPQEKFMFQQFDTNFANF